MSENKENKNETEWKRFKEKFKKMWPKMFTIVTSHVETKLLFVNGTKREEIPLERAEAFLVAICRPRPTEK